MTDRPSPEQILPTPDDRYRSPRRGRPVGDREAQRAKLLDAAISMIAKEGYAGTSLRKVAREAGFTTGAVTYYFANKEAMIVAVIEHLFDRYDKILDIRDMRASLEFWLDWNRTDTDLWMASFQLLAIARHDPAFAATHQVRYARYRKILGATLEKGQKSGKIRSDISADLLADYISAMGDGWMMMQPIETKRFTPARISALLDATVRLLAA